MPGLLRSRVGAEPDPWAADPRDRLRRNTGTGTPWTGIVFNARDPNHAAARRPAGGEPQGRPWRTHEVDFLARYPSGRSELIQVCADASDPDTAGRELRALAEARRGFPKARPIVLTAGHSGLPRSTPPGILAQPAYAWLLGSHD